MHILHRTIVFVSCACLLLSGCARDLSSDVYSSDDTLSLTMEGTIVNVRPIIIANAEELSRNTAGIISGGALGGAAGSGIGQNAGRTLAVVGGIVAGAALGALVQSELGRQDGFEYIVKLDQSGLRGEHYQGSRAMRNAISTATTNGLITVIQGNDVVLKEGQKIYAIFSEKRTRLIAQ
jgi:outer membrane lipoprotein SlyB